MDNKHSDWINQSKIQTNVNTQYPGMRNRNVAAEKVYKFTYMYSVLFSNIKTGSKFELTKKYISCVICIMKCIPIKTNVKLTYCAHLGYLRNIYKWIQ